MAEKWTRALNFSSGFTPTYHRICSDHFSEDDFYTSSTGKRKLHQSAVPFTTCPRTPLKNISNINRHKVIATKRPYVSSASPSPHAAGFKLPRKTKTSPVVHSYAKKPSRDQMLRKKIKILQQKVRRLHEKVKNLTQALQKLEEKQLISADTHQFLKNTFSGLTLELLDNELRNTKLPVHARRYSNEVKQFALTLNFYSQKAYNYIRGIFVLPHPSSIRQWTSSVNCKPGFLTEVINYLGQQAKNDPYFGDCCLIFDSMALRKETPYNHATKQYEGNVDLGGGISTEHPDTLASEALVPLVGGLSGAWKYPAGYFFVDKISAIVQTQLVKTGLQLLGEAGMRVHAVVCDGAYANQDTARRLGANLNVDGITGEFPHPLEGHDPVYFMLDTCHMLKLVRNMLATLKVITYTEEGVTHFIQWRYIEALLDLQESDTLFAANKLTLKHVKHWQKHKMNVRLAAQTFSSSVADAIDFLREDLKLPQFQGSQSTVTFIRVIDKLFDYLNSRNPCAKGYKHPFNRHNFDERKKRMLSLLPYFAKIRDMKGTQIMTGSRKTALLGFSLTVKSTLSVVARLLWRPVAPFRYVLTYKFSQDRIELFFSTIRNRGGNNNNPNTLDFTIRLRKVLLRNTIRPSTRGNCLTLDEVTSNSIFSFKGSKRRSKLLSKEVNVQMDELTTHCLQSLDSSTNTVVDFFVDNCLYYIAGFVSKRIAKDIDCNKCGFSLFHVASIPSDHTYCRGPELPPAAKLCARKNRGGLIFASQGVFLVVKAADKAFR